jgi:hypothetical protein
MITRDVKRKSITLVPHLSHASPGDIKEKLNRHKTLKKIGTKNYSNMRRGSVGLYTEGIETTSVKEIVSIEKIHQFRKLRRGSNMRTDPSLKGRITIEVEEREQIINESYLTQSSWGVFHPDSSFKIVWNIIGMIFIIYQSVMIPFIICFDYSPSASLGYFQNMQDFYFMLDILVTFNTGFYHRGMLSLTRQEIVSDYLKLWFWLDLAASFPYSMAVSAEAYFSFENTSQLNKTNNVNATSFIRLLKLMRMLRIIRLLRIVKLKKFLTYLEDYLMSDTFNMIIQFCQLGLMFIFIAHLGACFWFFIGTSELEDIGDSWIVDAQIVDSDISVKYIVSLYYYITTICTIGYGDIVPKTSKEKLFATFNMLLACGVFAYIIGSLSIVFSTRYDNETIFKSKVNDLIHFLRRRKVDKFLIFKIRKYLEHVLENKKENKIDEHEVLQILNKNLRDEIILHLNGQILKGFRILNRFEEFCILLTYSMQTEVVNPNENLFIEGEESTKLYFITKGKVIIYEQFSKLIYKILDHGCFGEMGFFGAKPRIACAESGGFLNLTYMNISDFKLNAFKYMQSDKLKYLLFKEELEKLYKQLQSNTYETNCYLCYSKEHLAPICNRFKSIDEFYKFKFLDNKYKSDIEIEKIFTQIKNKDKTKLVDNIYNPYKNFFDDIELNERGLWGSEINYQRRMSRIKRRESKLLSSNIIQVLETSNLLLPPTEENEIKHQENHNKLEKTIKNDFEEKSSL